jgi:hypothetical protein
MNIGMLLLGIWLFIINAEQLGWFALNSLFVAALGLIAAILIIVNSLGLWSGSVGFRRRQE